MADWYVRSGASGTGTGANWTNAKTTLGAAATASAAGDRIFVSEDHNETTGSTLTITFPGTAAAPSHVYCVNHTNHSGSLPPVAADLATTGVVNETGNAVFTINGVAEIYGLTFNAGTTTGTNATLVIAAAASNRIMFNSCALALRNNSAVNIIFGGTGLRSEVYLENTTIAFGTNAGQDIIVGCKFTWRNTASAASWGTMPTNLVVVGGPGYPDLIFFEGIDLSTFSNTIINTTAVGVATIKDCKLHASATVAAVPSFTGSAWTDVIRSDSGNTNYKISRIAYSGTLSSETTIVRTGGATDGTTPQSWKIVTSGNASFSVPFESPPMQIWNDIVSGTISLTIYGIAASIPYNDELWAEAVVLTDASYPLATTVTNKMQFLDTHAQWTTDGASSWGGSVAPFYATLTLSPRQKGYISIYVKAGKASQTYYVDPKPIIAAAPQISRSSLGMNELFAGIARSRIGIGM